MSLTMGQALAARRFKEQGLSDDAIAAIINGNPRDVKNTLNPVHLRPKRVKKVPKPPKARPEWHSKYYIRSPRLEAGIPEPERPRVPDEVLADQRRVLDYEPPNPTAALCGDPPPWRSALAKKASA